MARVPTKLGGDEALDCELSEKKEMKAEDLNKEVSDSSSKSNPARDEHFSSSVSNDSVAEAALKKDQGNEYFKQKKFTEAVDCYSRSIVLSPTAFAYANRAMANLKLKKFQEAEDDCTEALNMDDRYIKAYSRRATARKELGKLKECVEDAEYALLLEPHNHEIKKQYTEAKAIYDKRNTTVEDYNMGRRLDDFAAFLNGQRGTSRDARGGLASKTQDEMMDNGFPPTEPSNVTGGSANESGALPGATSSFVPRTTKDTKHASNGIYVDLIEKMDAIMNRDGHLEKCEVYGEVQVNSHLSGLPDLTLSFANPSILEDVRLHPCVRFPPWESSRIASFVPPDGLFKLMSYRVRKLKSTPIYVKPQITNVAGKIRLGVMVGIQNDPGKPIDSITIQFDLPHCLISTDLSANHGTVNILANNSCSWEIDQIPKDKIPVLSGYVTLEPGLELLHLFPTFEVGFRIMGIALSGVKIDKLDLVNMPDGANKDFRALTCAGQFEVRLHHIYRNSR